jgi:hypothetical protein
VTKRKKRKPLEIAGLAHREEEKTKQKDREEDMKEKKRKKEVKPHHHSQELAPHHLKIPLL